MSCSITQHGAASGSNTGPLDSDSDALTLATAPQYYLKQVSEVTEDGRPSMGCQLSIGWGT